MKTRRPTPEDVVAKLGQADVLNSLGQSLGGAIRSCVTEATDHRRRTAYGGLMRDQARRMTGLATGNQRLRQAIADLRRDKLILREAAWGHRPAPRADAPASGA